MTERERMLSGQLYDAGDETLTAARGRAKRLTWRYHQLDPTDWDSRTQILQELLGHLGEDSWIEPPFRCDYGTQISIGDHFFANYDCIFLDVAPITIGNRVMFGPRVCLYTAGHPLDAATRNTGLEFGKPIAIGDDVWLGGNVVVLPGVTIGAGTVVAAGSVVRRDLPPHVLAAGNPCQVLRSITEADRLKWEAQKEHGTA
ncbi:maltose O-acetyltransferase [Pusillibacter faecalis]|uniref:Acetyltransferase n=1 Tax=Pusillibacter faecalis TaxID=2714358 RepID=A0A810Q555_9FIRM|nr:sugar O-acetyltransferase [Pusillibacter faecalis]MCQ5027297.1 sugar O-acetyltransferase [Oscillibacter valericigenes]BCK83124.1 maltose O-acetyltransferase [Pusillibacter faecalis]